MQVRQHAHPCCTLSRVRCHPPGQSRPQSSVWCIRASVQPSYAILNTLARPHSPASPPLHIILLSLSPRQYCWRLRPSRNQFTSEVVDGVTGSDRNGWENAGLTESRERAHGLFVRKQESTLQSSSAFSRTVILEDTSAVPSSAITPFCKPQKKCAQSQVGLWCLAKPAGPTEQQQRALLPAFCVTATVLRCSVCGLILESASSTADACTYNASLAPW